MSIVMSAAQLDLKISGGVRVPGVPGRWSGSWSTHTHDGDVSSGSAESHRTHGGQIQEWQTCVYCIRSAA